MEAQVSISMYIMVLLLQPRCALDLHETKGVCIAFGPRYLLEELPKVYRISSKLLTGKSTKRDGRTRLFLALIMFSLKVTPI